MENLSIGLLLMVVGMATVFLILLIVIFGSQLIIRIVNKIAPEQAAEMKKKLDDCSSVRPVLEAAVSQLTGGKGKIVKITKI